MTHTPGPWRVGGHEPNCVFAGDIEDPDLIAEVWSPASLAYERHEPEQVANARLISASPALLAACEAAKELIQYPSGKTAEQRNEVLDQIAAAIKDAKGTG